MFVLSCQGQGCLARTYARTYTHAHPEQCMAYLCSFYKVQCSVSTLLSSSFPFWLAGCHTTVGHSRLLPEPLKPQRNISSQETNDSQKLQKTLPPLLGNRLRLGPKGRWKIAAFGDGNGLVRDQKRACAVGRRGEATLRAMAVMPLSVCLTVRWRTDKCSAGILAQSIAWMFTFGIDIWNRLEDEPKWLQSYPVLEIKSVCFEDNFQ